MSGQARHQQYVSSSAGGHRPPEPMGKFGRGQDVELEHGAKPFGVVLQKTSAEAEGGVVDQDVWHDAAAFQPLLEIGRCIRFAEIGAFDHHLDPMLFAKPSSQLEHGRLAPRDENGTDASGGQGRRELDPQTARSAGHHRPLLRRLLHANSKMTSSHL